MQRIKIVGLTLIAAVAMSSLIASSASASGLKLGLNQPAPLPGHGLHTGVSGSELSGSLNWSGYVAGTGPKTETFKTITSTYVQPAVTCPVSGAFTVFWVGLDGWNSETVEQDGTAAACNGKTPEYFAWWEMFPTNSIQPTIAIAPGDMIQATVKFSGKKYTLTVKDKTKKKTVTVHEECAAGLTCKRNSAEWIVERPSFGGSDFAPLADWGTMMLAKDKASTSSKARSISAFPNTAVEMVNNSDTAELATVGPLNSAGNSFLDTWDAVS
jgi:hypothetical protein